jgi:tetratricopeptide (TPR) repeat protein
MRSRPWKILWVVAFLAVCPGMAHAQRHGGGGGEGGGPPSGQGRHQHQGPPGPTSQPTTRPNRDAAVVAAEEKLGTVVDRLKAVFEASDDFKKALDNLDQAQSDYEDAVKQASGALASNPDYQAALAKRKAAQDAITEARQNGADDDQIAQLAMDAMAARSAVSKMEKQAGVADPTVKAAKDKLTDAGAAVQKLRDQFQDSLQDNPDWQAAKKELDDAIAKAGSSSS